MNIHHSPRIKIDVSAHLKRTGVIAIVSMVAIFAGKPNLVSVPTPRILASITHNWFEAEHFAPEAEITLTIYESDEPGATPMWQETRTSDDTGFIFVGEWEHPVDLVRGSYLVAFDGETEKQLVLEDVTLDIFDPVADYLAGTAPLAPGGRLVWVGTGNESGGCDTNVIADPLTGAWTADFAALACDVTPDMWGAAQVFDEDGDATEANPPPPPPTYLPLMFGSNL